jgi:hypothetical protein
MGTSCMQHASREHYLSCDCNHAEAGANENQLRSGAPSSNTSSGASVISGEHIDTSNLKGVPIDPTDPAQASEAGMPLYIKHNCPRW